MTIQPIFISFSQLKLQNVNEGTKSNSKIVHVHFCFYRLEPQLSLGLWRMDK